MPEEVRIVLSEDEALILHDWLAQLNARKDNVFSDQSVQRVLWDLEASLERVLVAPFSPDYPARLREAQLRVRDATD